MNSKTNRINYLKYDTTIILAIISALRHVRHLFGRNKQQRRNESVRFRPYVENDIRRENRPDEPPR